MKLFISADIEGCAGVALTDETHKKESVYQRFAEEMTEEVVAACEAAHEAGADVSWLPCTDRRSEIFDQPHIDRKQPVYPPEWKSDE